MLFASIEAFRRFATVRRPVRARAGAPLLSIPSNGMPMKRPLHVLGTNHLLELLPREEKKRVTSRMDRLVGEQGHVLYKPDTPITHVYFPLSGIVSLVTVLADGEKRVECGTIGNEGMAGLPL